MKVHGSDLGPRAHREADDNASAQVSVERCSEREQRGTLALQPIARPAPQRGARGWVRAHRAAWVLQGSRVSGFRGSSRSVWVGRGMWNGGCRMDSRARVRGWRCARQERRRSSLRRRSSSYSSINSSRKRSPCACARNGARKRPACRFQGRWRTGLGEGRRTHPGEKRTRLGGGRDKGPPNMRASLAPLWPLARARASFGLPGRHCFPRLPRRCRPRQPLHSCPARPGETPRYQPAQPFDPYSSSAGSAAALERGGDIPGYSTARETATRCGGSLNPARCLLRARKPAARALQAA